MLCRRDVGSATSLLQDRDTNHHSERFGPTKRLHDQTWLAEGTVRADVEAVRESSYTGKKRPKETTKHGTGRTHERAPKANKSPNIALFISV